MGAALRRRQEQDLLLEQAYSDDHEAERSSEWIRNLETFSGRVGAGTQRTAPSDADAVACSFRLRETEVRPWREWERLVRQYEAQSSDTLQDTIKAAILAHNLQDPEWRRHVGLNATRLQGYDAPRIEWKAMHESVQTLEHGRRERLHTNGS